MVGGRGKLFSLRTGVLAFFWGSGSQQRTEVLCGDRGGEGIQVAALRSLMGVGGRGRGKRGAELRGLTEAKQFIPFGQCFMFQGQRAGSISQECREKECFIVGQKEKVYQDWGWVG